MKNRTSVVVGSVRQEISISYKFDFASDKLCRLLLRACQMDLMLNNILVESSGTESHRSTRCSDERIRFSPGTLRRNADMSLGYCGGVWNRTKSKDECSVVVELLKKKHR